MENDNACDIKRWDILKRQLNNLSPLPFLEKIKKVANPILIDVRTPEEFAQGTLADAINMNFLGDNYWDTFDALDKDRPTFVFCRSGRRSVRTSMFMKNGGFKEVYNMDGGLNTLTTVAPEVIVVPVLD